MQRPARLCKRVALEVTSLILRFPFFSHVLSMHAQSLRNTTLLGLNSVACSESGQGLFCRQN